MRTYIRHPTSIPIQVYSSQEESCVRDVDIKRVRNLSTGGLSFVTDKPVKVGAVVDFEIAVTKPDYHGRGVIVWRREQSPEHYVVGIRFTSDNEYFHARMVEQVCQIEDYRQRLALKGRNLSSEQAAIEWIEKYSENFDKLSVKK